MEWRCQPTRTARGPLGLRLNGDANGVRICTRMAAGTAESRRCQPHSHGSRPAGPAVKRGRQRRVHIGTRIAAGGGSGAVEWSLPAALEHSSTGPIGRCV